MLWRGESSAAVFPFDRKKTPLYGEKHRQYVAVFRFNGVLELGGCRNTHILKRDYWMSAAFHTIR